MSDDIFIEHNLKICKICGVQFKNIGPHMNHKHNISVKEYYDIYFKNESEGICKNCGEPTNFINMTRGYSIYCNYKCRSNCKDQQIQIRNTKLKLYGYSLQNLEKLRETRNIKSIEHFKEYFSHTNCNYIRYEKENSKRIFFKCRTCNNESSCVRGLVDRLARNKDYNICPHCFNKQTTSRMENDVFNYIKTIYSGKIFRNNRSIIKPKELDFWFPELNKAIEFDGKYWHKDTLEKDSIKNEICKNKGITLLRISELNWLNKNNAVKNQINNFLNYI